ncbi:DUF3021 domain-containing protein [Christensenellaceae bacterium OttesenSCG-928-K19]|nr:DUF3021 domain-containing protein [Christensenellaceae bacterium OttesenSCG-928-K19]
MTLKEILQIMVIAFCIGITGLTVGLFLFHIAFMPDALLTIKKLGQMLFLVFAGDALFFIFYSKKELTVKQVRIRMIIHLAAMITLVVSLILYWGWLLPHETGWIMLVVAGTLVVYAIVAAIVFYRDRKTARKFNEVIRKYHDE